MTGRIRRLLAACSVLAALIVTAGCGATPPPASGPAPEDLATASLSPTAVPQGWPLAVPEGSKILVSRNSTDPDGRPTARLEFETQALGADVLRFFDRDLKRIGYTIAVRNDKPGKTTTTYTAPGKIATLDIDEAGGTTEVHVEITDAATGSASPAA